MSIEIKAPHHFISQKIDSDLESGKHDHIHTRFPPEPNGYLHIGHAKSICLNFGLAAFYKNSRCNLRFDDTNPSKEEQHFIDAIQEDVRWLGFDWQDRLFYASNYFQQLYDYAIELIKAGKAYVCDLNAEQVREYRGTLTQAGKNSPNRDSSVEQNLDLFARMNAGEFEDGSYVLRAKIDMASPNMNLRDPTIYRIRKGVVHHQTGTAWNVYPMYDFTHPISDALEGITHSLCTLEFEDHRPLYDWVLDNISIDAHPQQIEFSRLNLEYTIMSKRSLTGLVTEAYVQGWDDPRMPTIAGLRRRGYTPASIRDFCDRIGITKQENTVELGVLENCIREDLDTHAQRRMAVLNPLKVVIENYPEDKIEMLEAINHPKDESMGCREVPFTREIFIDRADFMEVKPNKKFKRLVTDGEVRLRYGYVIRCDKVIKDEQGEITELRCHYDEATLGANPEGRKVKGVIHWVSATQGVHAIVNLYDRLFTTRSPDANDLSSSINPDSLIVCQHAMLEPELVRAKQGDHFQFEREGYFCPDTASTEEQLIFNRTVTLRDSWAKIEQAQKKS